MNTNSRTNNALKNTTITIICHIVFILCSFICRTVLTKQLGTEYLGIGGLFSNILTILSFAELGLGSTLVYRLYKPFAENDYNKINLYVRLYKKIYRVIIGIILIIGIAIIPFLRYLVQAPNVKENLIYLYLLYLAHTLTSYLFVYKKTLLTASQNDYVVSLFTEIANVLMNIFQCLALILFKDYSIYMFLTIIFGIIGNIACSIYVDKKYKFLNNQIEGELSKKDIDDLKKDTKGLVLTKVASTAFSGTDNIFISSFIGIKYVGILSNYTLILSTINAMMNKVFSSITASVGNLVVSKNDGEKTEKVLFKMFFMNTAMYSYICICMILLMREFVVSFWLSNEFFLSDAVIILVIVELFLRSIHYPLYTTRVAFGLFHQKRIVFVIAAILNIALDFILVKPLGIAGLVIATIFCRSITYITDIYVLYKQGLRKTSINYYYNIFKWIEFDLLCYGICWIVLRYISQVSILYFVLKIGIITIIYLIMFIAVFSRTEEMKYFVKLFKNKLFKRKKKDKIEEIEII